MFLREGVENIQRGEEEQSRMKIWPKGPAKDSLILKTFTLGIMS